MLLTAPQHPPRFPGPHAIAWGEDDHGLWQTCHVGAVEFTLRWLPPGEFLMGSPAGEPERYDDEQLHPVTISRGFWLTDTACTQGLLGQVIMEKHPGNFAGNAALPVENVSWDDVQAFLTLLNTLLPEGVTARLPTEAEWEYACRAGTTTPFSFGTQISPQQVNYNGNLPYAGGREGEYRERTVPVKALPPNPWGLYQMHGNVWEWCQDWYSPYSQGPVADPAGPATGEYRVLRGGSWYGYGMDCRAAFRHKTNPNIRDKLFGFRFVVDQQP